MRRKQLYIDESADRALKALSRSSGRSEASLVREAVDRYLEDRAVEPGKDPLERMIGMVDDERLPDDIAENHDHYLYGAPANDG